MRTLIATLFTSIDGVFEAPGGEPGHPHSGWVTWYPFTADMAAEKLREIQDADALLLGRITYESFAGAWPQRTDDEGFADRINSMPKHVASRTLTSLEWQGSQLLDGELVDAVTRLKQEGDGSIWVNGSGSIVEQLLAAGLVDELRLMVFPVILGVGRRIEPGDGAARLQLVSSTPYDNGVSLQVFRPSTSEELARQDASMAGFKAAEGL